MPVSAILPLAIQILPLVTTGVEHFIAWLHALRSAAQQAGEWTPEQDAAFEAALRAKETAPAYQPDPPATGPTPTTPAA